MTCLNYLSNGIKSNQLCVLYGDCSVYNMHRLNQMLMFLFFEGKKVIKF